MAIVLSAVVFAALCVWLTVRIVNRKERWAKWTLAATLAAPVLYVASFGPACWIYSRTWDSESWWVWKAWETANRIYYPILQQWDGSGPVSRTLDWYGNLFSAAEVGCCYPTNGDPDDLGIGITEPDPE
jgi:hypothetical protein